MTSRHPIMAGRRRFLLLVCSFFLAVVVVTGGAIFLGPTLRTPQQVAADAAPPSPSLVTATVERRSLAEPVVLRGRLTAGRSRAITLPVAAVGANSVVTRLFVKPGDSVAEGRALLESSGKPMFAMKLPFPLYRDITTDARGPDVTAVQRMLRRVGYPVAVSGALDGQTRRHLSRFYHDRGYRIEDMDWQTGSGNANDSSPSAVWLPQSAALLIDKSGRRISKVGVRVGKVLDDPKLLLFELDQQAPTISAAIALDQRDLVNTGQEVQVTDDLTGETRTAEVASVGSQPQEGADGQVGFQVRCRFTEAPLEGASGSLRLEIRVATAEEVLAVPVSAVYSRPDGSTFVTVVDGSSRTNDIDMTAGRSAGGWVELREPTGPGLTEGVQVMVGELHSDR
ncbi:hypothetical protein ACN26Z_04720 [Verrucosispora sp. WMMD703]|uniref:hypothetical protein n=2 Tax=unclassified Micromonospora TaxID=2617518 RepID=UPI003B933F11